MAPMALENEDLVRDAEFNKALHGKSAHGRAGMTSMFKKDHTAQKAAVDEYFKHWDNKGAADETEAIREVSTPKPVARPNHPLTPPRPGEQNTRP